MTSAFRDLDWRDFGDWPFPWRAAACGLLGLLAFALPWSILTRPAAAQRQALILAGHDVQTQVQQSRQQADTLPALMPHPPEHVPHPPPILSELIPALAQAAQVTGLQGGQFHPQIPASVETDTDGEARARIHLRLHGTWSQLGDFATRLSAPTWDAILSVHDLRLRAQAASPAPELELTATVVAHPHLADAHLALLTPTGEIPSRNPFATASVPSHHASPQTVVGHLRSKQGDIELVLSADGQLRRVSRNAAR